MDFKRSQHIIRYWLLLIGMVSALHSAAQKTNASDFMIIGNETGIKSASFKYIQSIFRGKYSTWNNRQPVIIVLPSKKNASVADVAKQVYETTLTGMQKFWLSQVFQGRSNPPIFLDNDQEIINYVEENPGAIGIIRTSENIKPYMIINIIY
jgi:hypothetical protein